MVKVSVIVPAYNIAKELPRCLDSLLAQTLQDMEIIVVNDGSQDSTGEVINRYAGMDRRIVAVHKNNGGVTSARINGIQQASGAYIGFVDGDDEVEPDMFAVLLQNAQTYDADISHCGYQMIFPDGRVKLFHGTQTLMPMDRISGLKELISGARVEPGLGNKLYKREVLMRAISNQLIDPSIRNNEDLLLNYCLFLEAKSSIFYDICPYHYIVRCNSASRTSLNYHRIYDPLTVKRKIRNHAPEEIKLDAVRAYIGSCIDTYNLIVAERQKDLNEDLKNVKRYLAEERSSFSLLNKKQRVMAEMILHTGGLYAMVYRLYKMIHKGGPYQ